MIRIEQLIINIPPKMHGCNCGKCDELDGVKITTEQGEPSFLDLLKGIVLGYVQGRQTKATTDEPAAHEAATDEPANDKWPDENH